MSDDQKAAGCAVALDGAPEAYPYISFFERLGQPVLVPPDLAPNHVVVEAVHTDEEPTECEDEKGTPPTSANSAPSVAEGQ